MNSAKSVDNGKVLYDWFCQRHSESVPIYGLMLKEKASQFHDEMEIILLTSLQATESSCLPFNFILPNRRLSRLFGNKSTILYQHYFVFHCFITLYASYNYTLLCLHIYCIALISCLAKLVILSMLDSRG